MSSCACDPCEVPPGLPDLVWNRPGLAAVGYRIGTFPTFRRALRQGLRRPELRVAGQKVSLRSLRDWNARDPSDFAAALVDLWCYLADVLTFYQERTANEAFLRTAVFPDSVLRLARLLGYRPVPGSAAVTRLAFALEPGKRFPLPAGVRVQSVPGPDEKPQKFETAEALPADAVLNRVRVRPVPQPVAPFTAGNTSAPLDPTAGQPAGLAAGNALVLVTPGATTGRVEEKELVRLEPDDGRTVVHWSPAVATAGTTMYRWSRKFGLFGATHPNKHAAFEQVSGAPAGQKAWQVITLLASEFDVVAGVTTFDLDGPHDTIRPGQSVLITGPVTGGTSVLLTKVTEVSLTTAAFVTQSGRVTQIKTQDALGQALDRRKVTVYQLDDPPFTFSNQVFDPNIAAGATKVFAEVAATPELVPGRPIVLDDGSNKPHLAALSAPPDVLGSGVKLTFSPALPRQLEGSGAFALLNVTTATHGEPVAGEVLGDGDPSVPFQAFRLAKGPVTHLPSPGAEHGVASTLELWVDGVRWTEVPGFYDHGPDERVYVTDRDEDGMTTVRGGDGVSSGAAFTRGVGNVVARYRHGLGAVGNVPAGVLRTLLVRPVGVRSVTNPLPAEGGAEPETQARIRENAPNTVRTFGRVVSLRDYSDAAREYPGVAKAAAAWDRERYPAGVTPPPWDDPRGVRLVVVGAGGTPLSATVRAAIKADLDARRDPFLRLTVVSHRTVALKIVLAVVTRPEYDPAAVRPAVKAAVLAMFALDRVTLGRTIHLSDVFAAAQAVPGVLGVDVNQFRFLDDAQSLARGYALAAVQPHARLDPDELPTLADADVDVTTTTGATP